MSKPANVVCEDGVCRVVKDEAPAEAPAAAAPAAAEHPLVELLGESLLGKAGEVPTGSLTGEGKVVALYFSAHWCPPCRGFTPELAKWYNNFKAKNENGSKLEIVFISSDHGDSDFASYYAEMPWLALPFADRARKTSISKKYGVRGIPTMVLLDALTGELITKNGRQIVAEDSQGKNFPWKPPSLAEILDTEVENKAGEKARLSELMKDKVLGIYFSAHWCPPCRGFTPELAALYETAKAKGLPFEVVFVSADKKGSDYKEYLSEMPWWAVPYSNRKCAGLIESHFEVEGYPTLVILEPTTLKTITADAVGRVKEDPEGADFPWRPKAVEKLSNDLESVNTRAVCVVFPPEGGLPDADAAALDALAAPHWAQGAAAKLRFLLGAPPGDGLTDRVKHVAGAGGACAAILDIPNEKSYVAAAGEAAADLVAAFLAGSREPKALTP